MAFILKQFIYKHPMRHFSFYGALLLCCTLSSYSSSLMAAPPRKLNIGMFTKISTNSPFTIKPEKEVKQQESPLERDWALGSISPSGDEYSVTLINKKNRKDRVRFIPGFSSGEYKLLEVKQDAQSKMNSKVHVQKGSQKAWIGYDDKVLKISSNAKPKPPVQSKAAVVPNAAAPKLGTTNETNPTPVRRVRRVPITK